MHDDKILFDAEWEKVQAAHGEHIMALNNIVGGIHREAMVVSNGGDVRQFNLKQVGAMSPAHWALRFWCRPGVGGLVFRV